jgi:hypothetical protein
MKRSAKLVHGTNSNFIAMPVLVVKSLDNSTNALAGSQAAQHNVRSFAAAVPDARDVAASITVPKSIVRRLPITLVSSSLMFGYPQPGCGNSVPESATRLLTTEWAPQCLISQGGGLPVSERGLACLVLLFSDKAVTKHFGCQPPQSPLRIAATQKFFRRSISRISTISSIGAASRRCCSAMFSKATAKIQVGNAASGLK